MSIGFLGRPLAPFGGLPPSGACGEKPIDADRLPGSVERNWLRKSAPDVENEVSRFIPSPKNEDRIIFRTRAMPLAGCRHSPAPKNDPCGLTLRLAMRCLATLMETVVVEIEIIIMGNLIDLCLSSRF